MQYLEKKEIKEIQLGILDYVDEIYLKKYTNYYPSCINRLVITLPQYVHNHLRHVQFRQEYLLL